MATEQQSIGQKESIWNRRLGRRAVVVGGLATGAGIVATALLGSREKGASKSAEPDSASKVEWQLPELKDNLTSFSQLKGIVETYPQPKDATSEAFKLRTDVLGRLDENAIYEQNVQKFVDAYFNFRESDGIPTLRKLYRRQFYNLDLTPVWQADRRFKSEAEFLDDDFFFMAHRRHLNLDLSSLTQLVTYLRTSNVDDVGALSAINKKLDEIQSVASIKKSGQYSLTRESKDVLVTFDSSAASGKSKHGRSVEEDTALVSRALSLLPAMGNTTVKMVDSLPASGTGDANGDNWGEYRINAGGTSATIIINRNSPDVFDTALHEDAHRRDVGLYSSLVSRFNLPAKLIPLWIARFEAVQANRVFLDGKFMDSPFNPRHPDNEHFTTNSQALAQKYGPEAAAKKSTDLYRQLKDADDELLANKMAAFMGGQVQSFEPVELIRYQKYKDLQIDLLS